eukprot:272456-Pyramimonas_sp.AAC.1
MQHPNVSDLAALKKLRRHLKKYPCLVSRFFPEAMPKELSMSVDTDWAGCPITRKSTNGMVAMFGKHTLRTQSTLQSTVALSSGEAEYYCILEGGATGLLIKAILEDFGF